MVDAFMQRTRNFIENGQISIIQVGADNLKQIPNFAYTIGLQDLANRPEIITFSLPIETTQIILNEIADDILKGFDYDLDTEYTHLTHGGYPFLLRNVDPRHYKKNWFGYGLRHRGMFPLPKNFSAQQLFYTDKFKKFPWESGYSMPPNLQERLDL